MAEADQDVAGAQSVQAGVNDALLLTALDQSDDAIVIFARDGTITYANAAFERSTGYARAASIGRDVRFLEDTELNDPALFEKAWAAVTREERWRGTIIRRHLDSGALHTCHVTVSPIRTTAGDATQFMSVQRDMTGELQLATAMRRRLSFEMLGRLAEGMLQDFNDTCHRIIDKTEHVLADLPAEDKWRTTLKEVLRETDRLSDVTRPLQVFGCRQPFHPERVLPNLCVLDVIKRVRRVTDDRISFVTSLDEDLPSIVVDPTQLSQVLTNLCMNACDAMPDGGTITVQTACGRVREEDERHMGMASGSAVRISVCDTGTGLSPHILEHLFEPYFTTKPKGKGAGLGLATAYAIVRQLGGHIEVRTEMSVGSLFTVWLPVTSQRSAESPGSDAMQKLCGQGETVLVVEDEDAVRRILVNLLKRSGYTVLDAEDGLAGLACVQEHAGAIRLIVCDVLMPRMGGIEMIEKLRSEGVALPVLFVSGYADIASDRGRSLLALPNVACLNKPLALKQFLSKIKDLLKS